MFALGSVASGASVIARRVASRLHDCISFVCLRSVASGRTEQNPIQRVFLGVRVRQCRKPLEPNYFGIILNYLGIVPTNLVSYQRDKSGCFACQMFGPRILILTLHCDLFTTICLQLPAFGTLPYTARLTFRRGTAEYALFIGSVVFCLAVQERLLAKKVLAASQCLDDLRLLGASSCVSLTDHQHASIAFEASRI